jgi:hypothetical protein
MFTMDGERALSSYKWGSQVASMDCNQDWTLVDHMGWLSFHLWDLQESKFLLIGASCFILFD